MFIVERGIHVTTFQQRSPKPITTTKIAALKNKLLEGNRKNTTLSSFSEDEEEESSVPEPSAPLACLNEEEEPPNESPPEPAIVNPRAHCRSVNILDEVRTTYFE